MPYLVIPGALVLELEGNLQLQVPKQVNLDTTGDQDVDSKGFLQIAPERVTFDSPGPPGPGGVVF